jgi:hypothetical protein
MAKTKELFEGQGPDEEVLAMFRKHPVVMRKGLIIGSFGLLIGPLAVLVLSYIKPEYVPSVNGYMLILLASLVLALILFFPSWMSWYFSIYLVTNQRFLQIYQKGFFHKNVSDTPLSQIQSANYEVSGSQETLLGFGTIVVQTYLGDIVMREMLSQVELLRVHRFDPNELQFGDALVSSAVVWFRKRRPTAAHKVEFSYGGTLTKPAISRMVYLNDLKDSAKWTGIATSGVRAVIAGPRLADFFTIKRGIATGDNGFFIMSRDEIVSRDLPMEFFRPILPGPRHLETDIVESNADGTPKLVKQLFMLDCRIPETQLKDRYPTLWAYYQSGKPKVSETYLCSHRNPWYAQEKRPPALFICTYMGRNLAKRDKPFRFILNRSQATAANVYLLLYPNVELTNAIANNPELALRIWEFLNGIDSSTLLCEGRVYGGGLYKLEPKELANVPAQAIVDMLPIPANRDAKQCELFVQETTC